MCKRPFFRENIINLAIAYLYLCAKQTFHVYYLEIFRLNAIKASMPNPRPKTPMQAIANLRGVFKFQAAKKRITHILVLFPSFLVDSNPPINMSIPPTQKSLKTYVHHQIGKWVGKYILHIWIVANSNSICWIIYLDLIAFKSSPGQTMKRKKRSMKREKNRHMELRFLH